MEIRRNRRVDFVIVTVSCNARRFFGTLGFPALDRLIAFKSIRFELEGKMNKASVPGSSLHIAQ